MKKMRIVVLGLAVSAVLLLGGAQVADSIEVVYPAGMVSYWRFDEGSGIAATDSVGENDGTIHGATWTTGIVDGALSFDGVDDYVSFGDVDEFDFGSNPFSLLAWVKTTKTEAQHIMGKDRNVSGGRGWTFFLSSYMKPEGTVQLTLSSTGGEPGPGCCITSKGTVHDGNWHFVVVTKDGTNGCIYIDGVLDSTSNSLYTSIYANSEPFILGYHPRTVTGGYWKGQMDELAIYNRALSAEEIQQHYENGLNGLGYELVTAVDIDIKPGSDPNSINLGANGVIPVAILTTDDFDASTVDPFSVTLEGGAVRLKGKSGNAGALEDVDGDGDLDLVVQIQDPSLTQGSTEAVLEGATYDGTPIRGTDSVNIVP